MNFETNQGAPAASAERTPSDSQPESKAARPPGRLAGIDFGTVRIGIALTDARRTLASPYENYQRRDPRADAARFRRLVAEEGVAAFVVGLPVHLSGLESQKSIEAREFGKWLAETTGLTVEFFDERFTTSEADAFLGAAKLTKKQRKERRDKLAAQIMLTAYLESATRGQRPPGPLDG
ncbi:MAG TPA: Holliday junction resolvase RuvX [Pirellulales bacterium]|jgi:putative Holliday junction resolvase|nr:Holliday junction resolvase RuvX [Pirellulales bacterium]